MWRELLLVNLKSMFFIDIIEYDPFFEWIG